MIVHLFDVVFHAVGARLSHAAFDLALGEFGFDSHRFIKVEFINVTVSFFLCRECDKRRGVVYRP